MGKCVRHIAREAAGHEPIVLVWTHLRPSGRRFNSGSTNGPTPMQKIFFSVYRSACPALSRLGNCEPSNEESNSGAVKSHASWCFGLESQAEMHGDMSVASASINSEKVCP
jgi:hypothetical protein